MNHKLQLWLLSYGWLVLIVLILVGAIFYLKVFDTTEWENETVKEYMNETDGINTNGFICYNKEGIDVQRQAYIMVHELCHDIVEKEKEDFCK